MDQYLVDVLLISNKIFFSNLGRHFYSYLEYKSGKNWVKICWLTLYGKNYN
jgi:hypothetical protein